MKPLFCPSLMCMDFLHASEEIEVLNAGCDMYHVDIMDGHFCKNITLSPSIIKSLRPALTKPVDAHLMVTDPGDYLEALSDAGTDYISVHAETINANAFRTLHRIRELGCKTGVVLNPGSPLSWVEQYADQIDLLTIMTVDVGFSGQPFIPTMLRKIEQACNLRESLGLHYLIQIDGACGPNTYGALNAAGADAYVMGSSGLFRKGMTLEESCSRMHEDFRAAVEQYNRMKRSAA